MIHTLDHIIINTQSITKQILAISYSSLLGNNNFWHVEPFLTCRTDGGISGYAHQLGFLSGGYSLRGVISGGYSPRTSDHMSLAVKTQSN